MGRGEISCARRGDRQNSNKCALVAEEARGALRTLRLALKRAALYAINDLSATRERVILGARALMERKCQAINAWLRALANVIGRSAPLAAPIASAANSNADFVAAHLAKIVTHLRALFATQVMRSVTNTSALDIVARALKCKTEQVEYGARASLCKLKLEGTAV
mmetsp:Transcript_10789/g.28872  ORF Transcript_10789/g.28872 Transcript_10789/m.28872 type:complete len:165 (+) Transcript_10789:114-608(+)